jgi:hypothetical protein
MARIDYAPIGQNPPRTQIIDRWIHVRMHPECLEEALHELSEQSQGLAGPPFPVSRRRRRRCVACRRLPLTPVVFLATMSPQAARSSSLPQPPVTGPPPLTSPTRSAPATATLKSKSMGRKRVRRGFHFRLLAWARQEKGRGVEGHGSRHWWRLELVSGSVG